MKAIQNKHMFSEVPGPKIPRLFFRLPSFLSSDVGVG